MTKAAAKKREVPFEIPQWPAASVELRKLDKIIPYPNNPRTHPPEQIALLAKLMRKRGVDQPIVVDEEGVILKGHGRRLAALAAGFEEFPVVVHRGLPEIEKRAMRVEDNQVASLSEWDEALLRVDISDLSLEGFDMPQLGFDETELGEFAGDMGPASASSPVADPYGDELVAFSFGDYKARIGREIYAAFIRSVEAAKATGKFSLDDVLRSWMPAPDKKVRK